MVELSRCRRAALGILATFAMAAVCFTAAPAAAVSDEYERERAFFDRCPPTGDGGIEPTPGAAGEGLNIRFLFLADVEQCYGRNRITIQHVVKNLHQTHDLPFVWDGTPFSHNGLPPGIHFRDALPREYFAATPSVGVIRYGTHLNLPNSPRRRTLIWPPKQHAVDAPALWMPEHPDDHRVLNASINMEFRNDEGDIEELSLNFTVEHYDQLTYRINVEPNDIVVAIGGLGESLGGEAILKAFQESNEGAVIDYLDAFVQPNDMLKIPEVFEKLLFLILPSDSGEIDAVIDGGPEAAILTPVAFFNPRFEPIATTAMPFILP